MSPYLPYLWVSLLLSISKDLAKSMQPSLCHRLEMSASDAPWNGSITPRQSGSSEDHTTVVAGPSKPQLYEPWKHTGNDIQPILLFGIITAELICGVADMEVDPNFVDLNVKVREGNNHPSEYENQRVGLLFIPKDKMDRVVAWFAMSNFHVRSTMRYRLISRYWGQINLWFEFADRYPLDFPQSKMTKPESDRLLSMYQLLCERRKSPHHANDSNREAPYRLW